MFEFLLPFFDIRQKILLYNGIVFLNLSTPLSVITMFILFFNFHIEHLLYKSMLELGRYS